jgi:hypothetical protein
MTLARLQITPWGGVGLNWATAGLRRVERRGREFGLSPKTEGLLFFFFSNLVSKLYSNSFVVFKFV